MASDGWTIFHKYHLDFKTYGFVGTVVLSYSERMQQYRYKIYDLSSESTKFLKGYGTDPKLYDLLSKVRELKQEWRTQYSKKS